MAKFIMECPKCGKFVQMNTGLFGKKKKADCACGFTLKLGRDDLTSRKCAHCGNEVVFAQSKGVFATCPVCCKPINTKADKDKNVHFFCGQCGLELHVPKTEDTYTCPVCDYENKVAERTANGWGKVFEVLKYEGDADTLVWKHPAEDFKKGAQLIVHESQQAIFFRDGQALDTFGAGRYTLDTEQLPLLDKVCDLINHSESPFHSEVYFFNLAHQMSVRWGTAEKINVWVEEVKSYMALGARGTLNFCIDDVQRLLNTLVGTGGVLTRQDLLEDYDSKIAEYFQKKVQRKVKDSLVEVIEEVRPNLLALDQQCSDMSERVLEKIQDSFKKYGLKVSEVLVEGFSMPEKDDVGYTAWQSLLEKNDVSGTLIAIETDATIEIARDIAATRVTIAEQENKAKVLDSERSVIEEQIETNTLRDNARRAGALKDAQNEDAIQRLIDKRELDRQKGESDIRVQEMQGKGYTQKDVLDADVEKARAEAIGKIGGNMGGGSNGGGGSGMATNAGAMVTEIKVGGAVGDVLANTMKETLGITNDAGKTGETDVEEKLLKLKKLLDKGLIEKEDFERKKKDILDAYMKM